MRKGLFGCCLLLLAGCAASSVEAHAREQQCLALAMYWEARGEGALGMQAVGAVVLNRARDPRWPTDICAVVQQGGETPPCQFSWWCDGKSDRPRDARSWRAAMTLADKLIHARRYDPTRGALYFHSTAVRPGWKLRRTVRIGDHIFYK
ncbi:MAG: cell wall hydrolase [Pseudomonadota bacterium]